jgi:hypothetical protein
MSPQAFCSAWAKAGGAAEMASERQIAANRRNAHLSTGPRTAAGKARSRRNALKEGLTAKAFTLDSFTDSAQATMEALAGPDPSEVAFDLARDVAFALYRQQRCQEAQAGLLEDLLRGLPESARTDHGDGPASAPEGGLAEADRARLVLRYGRIEGYARRAHADRRRGLRALARERARDGTLLERTDTAREAARPPGPLAETASPAAAALDEGAAWPTEPWNAQEQGSQEKVSSAKRTQSEAGTARQTAPHSDRASSSASDKERGNAAHAPFAKRTQGDDGGYSAQDPGTVLQNEPERSLGPGQKKGPWPGQGLGPRPEARSEPGSVSEPGSSGSLDKRTQSAQDAREAAPPDRPRLGETTVRGFKRVPEWPSSTLRERGGDEERLKRLPPNLPDTREGKGGEYGDQGSASSYRPGRFGAGTMEDPYLRPVRPRGPPRFEV